MTPALAWLILFLPLFAFLLLAFPFRRAPKAGSYLSILAVAISFGLALFLLSGFFARSEPMVSELPFLAVGPYQLPFSIHIDALTAVMLVVVTSVSLLVQIYSQGYMEGDGGFGRYYAYLSLFTTSMLGLVLARDLLLVFAFWELVGVSSYLLIGFWYDRPAAADAAKKAFLTTRLGDFGFIVALMVLFAAAGTLEIPTLIEMAEGHEIAAGILTLATLCLFAGAAGKSAQFPLHVWLPDAMEGPTPVSALIHAATMVAAGVYLVARMFPLFEAAPNSLQVVAWIGGITAIFAATIGLTQTDIKRVMAFSTISQLGYMMLGLGMGSLVAGIFHLFTHAFFKALLFLGSGSVIHGSGTQDMREMGGLRKFMPVTYVAMGIASLSLAGVFPLAGFWSKDEILADAFRNNIPLFIIGEITVFLTAFYITRMMALTFFGEYRGKQTGELHAADAAEVSEDQEHAGHDSAAHGHGSPHESPWSMKGPMIVLAIMSVIAGFWALNSGFHDFVHNVPGVEAAAEFSLTTAAISTILALAGIAGAWYVYGGATNRAASLARAFGPLTTLVENKYYIDEFYDNVIIGTMMMGGSKALGWFDANIIDGIVNGTAWITGVLSGSFRRWQTGRVQYYGVFLALGAILVFAVGVFGAGSLIGR